MTIFNSFLLLCTWHPGEVWYVHSGPFMNRIHSQRATKTQVASERGTSTRLRAERSDSTASP